MAAANGNRSLYERWVRLHSAELYRYAYRLSGQHAAAEDLTQETFTEAWRAVESLREADKARAWLFQILRHRFARYVERSRRQPAERLPEQESLHPPDKQRDPAAVIADRDAIQAALNKLSPDLAKTFLMVFAENLTCRETAEQLGIPLGTVLSRLDRARRVLRGTEAAKENAATDNAAEPAKQTNGTPLTPRRAEPAGTDS